MVTFYNKILKKMTKKQEIQRRKDVVDKHDIYKSNATFSYIQDTGVLYMNMTVIDRYNPGEHLSYSLQACGKVKIYKHKRMDDILEMSKLEKEHSIDYYVRGEHKK